MAHAVRASTKQSFEWVKGVPGFQRLETETRLMMISWIRA